MSRRLRAAALGALLGLAVAALPVLVPDAPAAVEPCPESRVEPAPATPVPPRVEQEQPKARRLVDVIPPAGCTGPGQLPRPAGI